MNRHRVAPVLAAVLAAVLTVISAMVISVVMISSAPPADAGEGYQLTLEPDGRTSLVGTPFTATARFTYGGRPLHGYEIDFRASGANSATGSATTNASGHAPFTYTGTKGGLDTIVAQVFLGEVEYSISTSIMHGWTVREPPPPRLVVTASPTGTSGPVGSDFVVRAFVSRGGQPVGRADVEMRSTSSGQSAIVRNGTTDQLGRIVFGGYTRNVPGLDTVRITARWADQSASTRLTRTWTKVSSPPPETPTTPTTPTDPPSVTTPSPGPSDRTSPTPPVSEPTITPTPVAAKLSLSPDGVVSDVDTEFTVTAKLTSNFGDPISGQPVRFVTTKRDATQITKTATTDGDGTARFIYSRDRPGPDVVRAVADIEGKVLRARIDHRWSAADQEPPGEQGTLELGTNSVRPGGDLTLTGTGCPAGERVDISVNDRSIATTRADETGAYKVVTAVPDLSPGRYRVVASCSNVKAEATVDVVGITSMTGTAPASGVTGVAVLVFFVLLGSTLVRRLAAPDGDTPGT